MKLVLDASVAVKWFVGEAETSLALRLLAEGATFVAPDILLLETAAVLLKKERRGELAKGTATAALIDLESIGCELIGQVDLLKDATAMATTERHGLFDCLYLTVARARGLPLATFDRRLADLAARLAIPLWSPDTLAC
ncbi:type II toxin-antitoxin system VapC family toxin [Falsiroseomonas sp.]|uniref:type II toxin-antitoxin system VapC family toxin n=1 Tax=Falsiroseomonas sp. TaxID=2870721 RepID=UPI003F716731